MDPNFVKHLSDLASPDPNLRTQAEDLKSKQLESNPVPYLLNLAKALTAESVDENHRQLAGIIIKNAITGPNQNTRLAHQQKWLNIPPQQRSEIKNILFSGLASANNSARKGAGFAVAGIGIAELSVGEWLDLIPTLVSGIKQNNPVVQEGALQTIALVCEDIEPIPEELENQSGEILSVISLCAQADLPVEVRRASINAMYGALGVVAENFEVAQQRDHIMQIICNACKESDSQIQEAALRCLVKVAELYYDFLNETYMQAIWSITSEIMGTDSEAAPYTIEFWSTIAEAELDDDEYEFDDDVPRPQYSLKILSLLIPRLCANLLKQVDCTDDEDEWNMASASAACIAVLSECTKENIIKEIVPFIQLIKNENWRQREASTMAFGSILAAQCRHEDFLKIIPQVLGILLDHLANDSNDCVRSTSAWAISQVASYYPDIVAKGTDTVIKALVGGLSHEDSIIAYYSCFGILQILTYIYSGREYEATNELSKIFRPLFAELLKAADRDDSETSKLRITAYESINNLIMVAPLDCVVAAKELINPFLGKLEQSFNMNVDIDTQKELHSYIPLVLQTIIKRVGPEIAQSAQNIYNSMTKVFITRKAIIDEALNAIASLFEECPPFVPSVFGNFTPYFIAALQKGDDPSILKSGLYCLGSICDSMKENLFLFDNGVLCDNIVNTLRTHLQNPEVEQDLRPLIITSFADIALAINGHFSKYFGEFYSVFSAASDIAIPPGETNEDHIEYVISLREAVLEAIPPVMDAMCTANKQLDFVACLGKLVTYMQCLWDDTEYRTKNIVSSMVGLLGDLLRHIIPVMNENDARTFVGMPFVDSMLQHGMYKSPNPETRQIATWAHKQMKNLTSKW